MFAKLRNLINKAFKEKTLKLNKFLYKKLLLDVDVEDEVFTWFRVTQDDKDKIFHLEQYYFFDDYPSKWHYITHYNNSNELNKMLYK